MIKNVVARFICFYFPRTCIFLGRLIKNNWPYARKKYLNINRQSRCLDKSVIYNFLSQLGIKRGDVVMVHSSWDQLSEIIASPGELISVILDIIGESGTLCMPVFPDIENNKTFSLNKTPSTSGLVTEIFRRYPKVIRSCHTRSVASLGPKSHYLLSEHHLSPYPCSEYSPFSKFSNLNAKILCAGVPDTTNTMFHCGEDILRSKFPHQVYESKPRYFICGNEDNKIYYYYRLSRWAMRFNAEKMLPYFSGDIIKREDLMGVYFSLTCSSKFKKTILSLAKQGKTMYSY